MKKNLFLSIVFALIASAIAGTVYVDSGGMDMYSETNELNAATQVIGKLQ